MRTEQEVLNDFEKLGYSILCNTNSRLTLENFDERLTILKEHRWYSCKDSNNWFGIHISMQTHQLLHELFICWGWL